MATKMRGQFFFRERVQLLKKHNGGFRIPPSFPLGSQLVADLAGTHKNPLGILMLRVRKNGHESWTGEIFQRRTRSREP